jgi:hypothetical protein
VQLIQRLGRRIGPQLVRVLQKVRTPLGGTNLSAFSRYASQLGPGVAARWDKIPARRPGADPRAEHVNALLLPWPLRIRESDFRPLKGSVQRLAKEPFGFFEFAPAERLDLDLVDRTLAAARDEVDIVELMILPESAIDETEIDDLEAVLGRRGVAYLVTGVRQGTPQPGRLPGNWVHFGVNSSLEARPVAGPGGRAWPRCSTPWPPTPINGSGSANNPPPWRGSPSTRPCDGNHPRKPSSAPPPPPTSRSPT